MTTAEPTTPQSSPQEPPARVDSGEDCSFCRRAISPSEIYHRVTVGMNEDGPSSERHAVTVEEVSELVVCATCHPRVSVVLDGFLERLWDMMIEPEPEPYAMASDDLPPSEPTLPALSLPSLKFPLNLLSSDVQVLSEEMLALAARAFPASPAGFTLGLAVGRFVSAGLSSDDIHLLVDNALGTIAPRVAEGMQS